MSSVCPKKRQHSADSLEAAPVPALERLSDPLRVPAASTLAGSLARFRRAFLVESTSLLPAGTLIFGRWRGFGKGSPRAAYHARRNRFGEKLLCRGEMPRLLALTRASPRLRTIEHLTRWARNAPPGRSERINAQSWARPGRQIPESSRGTSARLRVPLSAILRAHAYVTLAPVPFPQLAVHRTGMPIPAATYRAAADGSAGTVVVAKISVLIHAGGRSGYRRSDAHGKSREAQHGPGFIATPSDRHRVRDRARHHRAWQRKGRGHPPRSRRACRRSRQ